MKIGFNVKKIINKIANHETRITTLENNRPQETEPQ